MMNNNYTNFWNDIQVNNGVVDDVLNYRFAVMNVWRRWDGGNDMPLGVCSGDSLYPDDSDMVGADLVYRNRTGEIYNAVYKPEHTFFHFPNMSKNEAYLSNTLLKGDCLLI